MRKWARPGSTRTEGSTARLPQVRPLLSYVGSVENGFEDAGRQFVLDSLTKVRFGRSLSPSAMEVEAADGVLHIGIPLAWVSGVHAELVLYASDAPFGFTLTDLLSRNGTSVEGRKVEGSASVSSGDIFEIGRSFWMVREAIMRADNESAKLDPVGTASPALESVLLTLERLAPTQLPILLMGETGTGKNRLAEFVHRQSGRPGKFSTVNLAAAGPDGPTAEAFSALAHEARRGTLFLDEIGQLPRSAQAGWVSVLSSLSDDEEAPRLITASAHDLRDMVTAEDFRPDLYSRIAGYEGRLPALRDRREDLGLLTQSILMGPGAAAASITTQAFRRVLAHPWPFNIRELQQTLRAGVATSDRPNTITRDTIEGLLASRADVPSSPARIGAVRRELLERLAQHSGDVPRVADALKCDVGDIERWLERFQIEPGAYRQ